MVPGFNNNDKFRLELNLNSIFRQNYTNYFTVIINDASDDGSDELFRKYLEHHQISPEKYVYVEADKRNTALENIYKGVHEYCSEDSIVMAVDGDDELIGRNVLKAFNAAHQQTGSGVIYSNYARYIQGNILRQGDTLDYTP